MQDQVDNCEYAIRAHQLCMDLNKIMMLINSTHSVDEIFLTIVENTCNAIGCESARIAMREDNQWVMHYSYNFPEELMGQRFSNEDLPHATLAMITKRPIAIEDAYQDPRANTQLMKSFGTKSLLVLPLLEKGVVVGALSFGYQTSSVSFTDTEIEYAENVANGVAIALYNARQFEAMKLAQMELKESKRLTEALNEINTVIHSTHDFDEIMKKVLQLASAVIGAETSMILSKEGDWWRVRYVHNMSNSLIGHVYGSSEVLHTAVTAQTKQPLAISDVSTDTNANPDFACKLGILSILDFPLIVKGEVIGDLAFHYHSHKVEFSIEQIEFVRKLQASISLALENARLFEALQETNSLLLQAEVIARFGHFSFDVRSTTPHWSPGLFHLLDRDPRLGEPTLEGMFRDYDMHPTFAEMESLIQNNQLEIECRLVVNGDLVHHQVKLSVKRDEEGNITSYLGTVHDITEQRTSKEAVEASERFKQAVLDALPANIAVIDSKGIIVAVNQPWLEFAEENGASDLKKVSIGADYIAACRKAVEMAEPFAKEALDGIEAVLAEKISGFTLQYPCHCLEEQRWFVMNVIQSSEDSKHAVITHFDISATKLAEIQIEELNRKISAHAADLEAVNRELETYSYTVAHDLRKPLTVINGYCQALTELCSELLNQECREYLKEAYEGTWRMNRIIDVLLNFSRVANAEPKREKVDLSSIVEAVYDELQQAEPDRHVALKIQPGVVVIGDAELLHAVLANLLGNAWKYTARRTDATIQFGQAKIAGEETFFVKDNGIGFNMTDAQKIFQPFQRLENLGGATGIGIGLATVERIIRRHGGRVWSEGEPGKGATFYFTLPDA